MLRKLFDQRENIIKWFKSLPFMVSHMHMHQIANNSNKR